MSFIVTSPATPEYNCIAWAAGDSLHWWEPDPMGDYYWPPNALRKYSFEAYVDAFKALGFEICKNLDLEKNYEKIVLYGDPLMQTIHASRQLSNGQWTSKLGTDVDIEHAFVKEWKTLENLPYGDLRVIMKKPPVVL